MARIKDIVEAEKQRPDMAATRIIHLYAEGTFCHAYEWSAWLWQRFVREFKVTHTLFKDTRSAVFQFGWCEYQDLSLSSAACKARIRDAYRCNTTHE